MIGVVNRIANVVCEVGTCFTVAAHTEYVTVIPGDPNLRNERHQIDIALCQRHDSDFQQNGLVGIVTAYGDRVVAVGASV
jgi:hypothetical protein